MAGTSTHGTAFTGLLGLGRASICRVVEHAANIIAAHSSAGSIGFLNVMKFSNGSIALFFSFALIHTLVVGNIALIFRADAEPAENHRYQIQDKLPHARMLGDFPRKEKAKADEQIDGRRNDHP